MSGTSRAMSSLVPNSSCSTSEVGVGAGVDNVGFSGVVGVVEGVVKGIETYGTQSGFVQLK